MIAVFDANKLLYHVNLDNYTASDSFVGFSERKSCNFEYIRKIFHYIFDEYDGFYGGVLATSLYCCDDVGVLTREYDISEDGIRRYFIPLFEAGYIKIVTCDSLDEAYYQKLEREFTFFYLDRESLEDLERLFFIVCLLGGVNGHLFFIDRLCSLMMYPHDDCGVGFFAISDNGRAIAQRLLDGIKDV